MGEMTHCVLFMPLCVSPGEKKEKLISTINKHHGEAPKDDKADLIRDNVSEGDPTEKQDIDEDRKWKKQDET